MRTWIISTLLVLAVTAGLAQDNSLTLQECRKMAVEQNKKIHQSDAHHQALQALSKSARSQHFPKASFTGGYLRTNKDFSLLNEDIFLPVVPHEAYQNGIASLQSDPALLEEAVVTKDFLGQKVPVLDEDGNPLFKQYAYLPKDEVSFGLQNLFLMNVGITQPLYTGGRIRTLVDIAESTSTLFEAKKEMTIQEVILQTDEYFWKVTSLQEKVKLTETYKSMVDTLIYDLENLLEEGIITRNEVLKAKVKRNSILLQLTKAQNGLELARMALNQTLGVPLDTTLMLETTAQKIPNTPAKSAETKRPELKMANQSINIADGAVNLMRARFFPNIVLSANYTFMNPNPYDGLSTTFGSDWNVGIMMTVPIYHWGEKRHTLQAAKLEKQAAEAKYEEVQELIEVDIAKASFTLKEAQRRLELTTSSLQQADENLEITRDNFSEGLVNSTEVLEAQALWQEAYAEKIEAQADVHLAYSNLLKAKGKLTLAEPQEVHP